MYALLEFRRLPAPARRALLLSLFAAAAPHAAHAQTLQGRALDRVTQQPVAGAEVILVDAQGEAAAATQTGAGGDFRITGPAAGEYRLAASGPGYQTMLSNPLQLALGQQLQVEARLTPRPVETADAALPRPAETADAALPRPAALPAVLPPVTVSPAALPPASRGISGRVVEAGTGRPVSRAAVTLLNELGHHVVQATADTAGNFHLPIPRPGRMRLRADRVGYQRTLSESITVVPSDTVRVELLMSTDAVVLAPLTVVASSGSVSRNSRMAAFRWRADHNPWGRFMGPEQIRRINPFHATDILQQIPGVRVEGSGLTRVPTVRGRFGSRCVPTFYVDGLQATDISLDELVSGPDVTGVEVYDQPFEAPPEFLPSGRNLNCGVIVVWTKQSVPAGS